MNLRTALLGAAMALLSSASGAAVTIGTSVVGSPTYTPGSNVTLRVEVTGNTGAEIPALAALRLQYNSATFAFVSAVGQNADGFLGEVNPGAIGAEELVSGLLVSRDIPTAGNFSNTDLTPEIMDITLQVKATPTFPTSISVDVDPGVSAGLNSLLSTTGAPITGRTFDNAATTNVGPGGPVTGVVVSSAVVGAPTLNTGVNFDVKTVVSSNATGQVPAAAVLRVTYDSALLAFVGASGGAVDGFIGDVDSGAIGAETPISGTTVYRDIPTLGNFSNTDLTPEIMTVTFQVLAPDTAFTSIGYDVAPGVSAGLNSIIDTASNPITPRTFDNVGTTDLILNPDPGTQTYVALRGNDSTGTGTFAKPYRTIQKGVNSVPVGGTVSVIEGGVFDEFTTITRSLTLRADDPNTTVTYTGGSADALIWVAAQNVTIEGFNFEIFQPGVIHGIYGQRNVGQFNNLTIRNNAFYGTGINGVPVTSAGTFIGGGGNPIQLVRAFNNTVDTLGSQVDTTLDRGFMLESVRGDIGAAGNGNTFVVTRRQDVLIRFSTEGTTITANSFAGAGVDLSSPGRDVVVSNNTFNAGLVGSYSQAIITKASTAAGRTVTITGNTITGYPVGLYAGGSTNVTASNNTFNGSAIAFNAHVILDSGYDTNSVPGAGTVQSSRLSLLNNTLNQSPVPGVGVRIDNTFGSLYTNRSPHDGPGSVFSGNIFNFANGEFFRLASTPGLETTSSFNAESNTFLLASGLKAPSAMVTIGDQAEINNRTFDQLDEPAIGQVIYNLPAGPILNDAYVSLAGSDITGDGTIGNPFRTIQRGVDVVQPTGRVRVIGGGRFDERTTINKALSLLAMDPNTTVTASDPGTTAIVTVRANNVSIDGFGFEILQQFAPNGVFARDTEGPFNNLRVNNCVFVGAGINTGISTAINLLGTGSPVEFVQLTNNRVTAIGDLSQTTLDRGFTLESISGDVGLTGAGNVFEASRRQDVLIRFVNAGTTITANTFRAAGVDLSEPNRSVIVSNNTFDATLAGVYPQAVAVKARRTGGANFVLVDNNTITDYPVGVLTGGSNNVTVSNNTFNGSTGTFSAHVVFDSGYPVSSLPPASAVRPNQLALLNNTFNQSPIPGVGVQIDNTFAGLYTAQPFDEAGTAFTGNVFNFTNGRFFQLSDAATIETTASFNAENNTYQLASGLKAPAAMVTVQDQNEINDRTFDRLDNATLGQIIYNLPGSPILNEAYVSLAGDDVTGDGTITNPFRTVQKGVSSVEPNGDVFVIDGGTFDEAVTIGKSLTLSAVDPNTTLTFTGGAAPAVLDVQAPNVTVLGFAIEVVQPDVINGIRGNDNVAPFNTFDGLRVENTTIVGAGTNGLDVSSAIFANNTGGLAESVTLYGNTVSVIGDPINSTLDRGFWLERAGGQVGGNGVGEGNTFVIARRQDILSRNNGVNTVIAGNSIQGAGIDLSSPRNTVLENNTFNAVLPGVFAQGLIVKAGTAVGQQVIVRGNSFTGYPVAVNLGGSNIATVDNNTFNGSTGGFSAHVVFDSGYDTASLPSPGSVPTTSMTLTNNTFNASPVDGVGVQVQNTFAALYTNRAPHSGTGTTIANNVFNYTGGEFFRLSDSVGTETTASFNAENNTYLLASGLKAPAAMTSVGDQAEINTRTFDVKDNASIGEVIYNLPAIVLPEAYVSLTGDDVTGDGTITNPFRTIQKGVTEVNLGGTVFVIDGGVFDELTTISKSLTLSAVDPNTTVTYTGGQANGLVTVRANNVRITGFNFEVFQPEVVSGIHASDTEGPFNGLTVDNSTFVGTGTNGIPVSNALFARQSGGPVESVTFTNNSVLAGGDATNGALDRGVWLEGTGGSVTSSTFEISRRQDVLVRFTEAPVTIANNTIRGSGVDLSEVFRSISVANNTFDAILPGVFGQGVVVKLSNRSGEVINIADNTFTGYPVGVYSGGSNNVTVQGNTFNGSSTAFSAHVLFDSGYPTGSLPATGTIPANRLQLLNNTFNQSPVAGIGVQVDNTFASIYTSQPFDGPGSVFSGNVFNFANGEFFRLSDAAGTETTASFNAENNTYSLVSGLKAPSAMVSFADQAEINSRTFDVNDNPVLGEVIYNLPAIVMTEAYVSLSGSDTTGDGTITNPFRTIQKGATEVNAGGNVFVINGGTFDEAVTIAKGLTVTAVDPNTTVTFTGGPAQGLFDVRADNVTIGGFNFEILQPEVVYGVVADDTVAPFDNLSVTTSTFAGAGSNGVPISGAVYANNTGGVNERVTLLANTVTAVGDPIQSTLDRGFFLERVVAQVGSNVPGEGNTFLVSRRQDVLYRFELATATIQGNTFRGAGLDLSAPGDALVENNTFQAIIPGVFAQGLIVKAAVVPGRTVDVRNNTFVDYPVGVYAGGSTNVRLDGNTFNGSSTAFSAHVVFDSGYPTGSLPGVGTVPSNRMAIVNNTFNQSPVPGVGVQIDNSFAALYDSALAFDGPGTSIDNNVFNYATGEFFRLSDASGAETTQSFLAENNSYLVLSGLQSPAGMTNASDQQNLNDRTFDQLDNATLGLVIYNLPTIVNNADVALTGTLSIASPFSTLASPSFTYTLTNNGPDGADGTTVALTVPGFGSLTYNLIGESGGAASSFTVAGDQVEVTASSLPVGGSVIFEVIGNAPGTVGTYTAQAQASVIEVDGDLSNNNANIAYEIQTQADVSIVKSVSQTTATVGTVLTYTLTVSNNGPNDASNVTVSDPLPVTAVLVGAPGSSQGSAPSVTAGTLTAQLGTIAAGNSATVTYQLLPTQFGALDNTAFVTTTDTDTDSGNNSSAVSVAMLSPSGTGNVDLAVLTSTFPVPGTTNQALNIVSSVVNLGVDTETSAVLAQLLPPSFSVVSITSDKGTGTVDGSNLVTVEIGALSAGETVNVSILAVPTVAGLYEAPVLVGGQVFDFDLTNNSDLTSLDVIDATASTDLSLSKTSVDATVNLGERTTWTITLVNNGPNDANNVAIYDTLPSGFEYENGLITGGTGGSLSVLGNRLTAYFPTVFVGETVTVDLSGRFTVAGVITNEALVSSSEDDPDGGRDASASVTVVIPPPAAADLVVTKSVDQATVVQDSEVVFTMTVTNNGPSTATNMLLADPIPAEFEIVSAFANVGAITTAGNLVSLNVPEHPAGVTATLTVRAIGRTPGVTTNTASASSSVNDPVADNNASSVTVTILEPLVDLTVVKTVDRTAVLPQETVTFTIQATNNGPTTATNVLVQDTLPTGLELVSASSDIGLLSINGTLGANLVVPAHPVGVTATVTIVARATTPGVVTNTATISSDALETFPDDNASSVDVEVLENLVDLVVTKTADRNAILLGETVTFTIEATNNGPTTATDVLVEDTLPAGLELVSASADIGLISITGQTASLIVPAHPVGVTATLTVVARGVATGSVTNTATIASASVENAPGNESSSASVDVSLTTADISVATSISNATPPLDTQVTFVATITNNGPQAASNAVANVTVPSGYVLQSITASTGLLVSTNAFNHTITIPTFASGGVLTVTIVATAQVTNASNFEVSVSSSTFDSNSGNNTGSRTVTADPTVITQQTNGFEAPLGPGELATLGQQISGVIGTFHSSQVGSSAGVYTAAILPSARLYNSTGFVSEGAASLPYSAVGPNRIVRGKFSVYQTPLSTAGSPAAAPGTDPSRIPALRIRVANRFAVSSMLEVNSHVETDPGIAPYAEEITPSADPANPSIYRVDLDPMDVPYLVSNGATERIRYGFEALKNSAATQGFLNLTEVSLGTYSIYATTSTVPVIASYGPDGSGAGQLAQALPGASLSTLTFQVTPAGEVINFNTPGNPVPQYAEGSFGVTLDTRNIPVGTVGAIAREFAPGDFPSRPRVQEGRQYQVRMNLSSIQSVLNQSEVRLRARTVGFAYTQFLVVGGAWAVGTDPLAGNAALANQSLPGFGTQNPDRRAGQTNGGWYNLIIHSPLNVDIRPDIAGTLGEKMPLLSGQPGPGSSDGSFRDLRVALDLIDGSSQGPNAGLEQGQITLDRIEVREWNQVPD